MRGGMRVAWAGLMVVAVGLTGCRSSVKVSDTPRSATQQLLLSSTLDSVVGSIDFYPLSGERVYLDTTAWGGEGAGYIAYRIRAAMGAHGVLLVEDREEAVLVVEVGLAVHGTDSENLEFGLTGANNLPAVTFCVRDTQYAVSQLSMFAYHRENETIVWNSGQFRADGYHTHQQILGMNPTRSGTIEHSADRLSRCQESGRLR